MACHADDVAVASVRRHTEPYTVYAAVAYGDVDDYVGWYTIDVVVVVVDGGRDVVVVVQGVLVVDTKVVVVAAGREDCCCSYNYVSYFLFQS